jgi:hypothetical protein
MGSGRYLSWLGFQKALWLESKMPFAKEDGIAVEESINECSPVIPKSVLPNDGRYFHFLAVRIKPYATTQNQKSITIPKSM